MINTHYQDKVIIRQKTLICPWITYIDWMRRSTSDERLRVHDRVIRSGPRRWSLLGRICSTVLLFNKAAAALICSSLRTHTHTSH